MVIDFKNAQNDRSGVAKRSILGRKNRVTRMTERFALPTPKNRAFCSLRPHVLPQSSALLHSSAEGRLGSSAPPALEPILAPDDSASLRALRALRSAPSSGAKIGSRASGAPFPADLPLRSSATLRPGQNVRSWGKTLGFSAPLGKTLGHTL